MMALQDDVTAVATLVIEQFASEIGRNEAVAVREARWGRDEDYTVRHKLRPPEDWRAWSRQLGIAGENTAPIVDRRLP